MHLRQREISRKTGFGVDLWNFRNLRRNLAFFRCHGVQYGGDGQLDGHNRKQHAKAACYPQKSDMHLIPMGPRTKVITRDAHSAPHRGGVFRFVRR